MIFVVNPNPAVDRIAAVRFETGRTLRPARFMLWPGGSGIHAAKVAHNLGAPVRIFGFTGGHTGALLTRLLQEHGLPATLLAAMGETRQTYSILDVERGNICDIAEPGPVVSAQSASTLLRIVSRDVPDADMLILSGSIPTGCPHDLPAAVINEARRAGIPAIVDLAGEPLANAVTARPWMIKPSLEELETELGRRADAADLLERGEAWLAAGVQHVCISLGSGGLLWLSTAGTNLVTIHAPVVPYNSIGCGDTLVGATGVAYLATYDTGAALRHGVAAATANLRYDQPGYCTSDDVRDLVSATRIDPITKAGIQELLIGLPIRSRRPAASPQEAGAELS